MLSKLSRFLSGVLGRIWSPTPPPASEAGVPQAIAEGAVSAAKPMALAALPPSTTPAVAAPDWFTRDVQRKAKWLPAEVQKLGIAGAYAQRWNTLPADIKATLGGMAIPPWMVALIPTDPAKQPEIEKQFRFMVTLAGPSPPNRIAARAEQLLLFGGSAQLPTPGDNQTGASLGAEGCTAAMSKYVLAQLKKEFPKELAGMSDALTRSQYSPEMRTLLQKAATQGLVRLVTKPFKALLPSDILPGSLMIAEKPGGTHVFGWTRVPAGWRWDPGCKMAIGNTGLPQFGDRMILAQEFVTMRPDLPGELAHNQHGPINGNSVIYVGGKPDLSDPRTNVYAVKGANFILVNLLDPGKPALAKSV